MRKKWRHLPYVPYVLMSKWMYLCPNTAKVIIKTLLKTSLQWHIMRKMWRHLPYVPYVLMSKRTYLCPNTIKWTINSFTCPLANPPIIVNFSVRNLTLKVAFLSTNCPPCRKKSILAKVCFDAKWGGKWTLIKWIFIWRSRHLHHFWGGLLLNVVRFGAK